jgi:hypothetical protein
MKKLFLLLTCVIFTHTVWAQTPTATPISTDSSKINISTTGGNPGSAFGLILSTNGVGLQFAQNIGGAKMLAVRVGGMYMPYKLTNLEYDFDGTVLVINGDIKLGSVQALVDFHPFKNAFKITGGLAYMLSDMNATAFLKDSVKQDEITISPEEAGKIDVGVKIGPLCPYLGIGFGRAIPKSRVSFNFEVGGYYITHPEITFVATGMLEPSSSNEKIIQDNVKGYSWLPMMNFSLNFKLGK